MITALQLSVGSMFLEAQEAHPNKMRFRGVLVRLDEASTKPPNGSNGHRIYVSTDVAKRRLGTLINMGLNYSPTLDGHAQRRKVGVITKAWIDGQDLKVEGHVWKHDFPEAEKDLKQPNLGMSMELGDVDVEDPDAQVWKLTDFSFLGATILDRNAAAYYKTAAIAARADQERSNMAIKRTAKKPAVKADVLDGAQIAEIAANAAATAVTRTMTGVINRQTEILAQFGGRLEELEIGATASEDEDEEAAGITVPVMKTKKVSARKSEDEDEEAAGMEDEEAAHQEPDGDEDGEDSDDDGDEDDMDSEGIDVGDLKKVGPKTADPGNDDPGSFNEDAKNKGNKTSSEDKVGSNVNKAVTGSAIAVLRKQVKKLAAAVQGFQTENASLKTQLKSMRKQVSAAAEKVERRSLPPELIGLLNKSNIDTRDLLASGTQLSVSEVDGILAGVPNLDNVTRMTLKNKFRQAGMMEDGQVTRGIGR